MTIANFEHKLAQYAHLIIKTGVNIQPGQTVEIGRASCRERV